MTERIQSQIAMVNVDGYVLGLALRELGVRETLTIHYAPGRALNASKPNIVIYMTPEGEGVVVHYSEKYYGAGTIIGEQPQVILPESFRPRLESAVEEIKKNTPHLNDYLK